LLQPVVKSTTYDNEPIGFPVLVSTTAFIRFANFAICHPTNGRIFKRAIVWTWMACGLISSMTRVVVAHSGPAGVRVDQELTVTIHDDHLTVDLALELNRPGAFWEVILIDRDGDGEMTEAERQRYFTELGEQLRAGIEVIVNGEETPLAQVGEVELAAPAPNRLRKRYRYRIVQPDNWRGGATIELHNDNYLEYDGRISLELVTEGEADIVYDSRTKEEGDELPATFAETARHRERDIVFRYVAGSGRYAPNPDALIFHYAGNVFGHASSPTKEDSRLTRMWPVVVALVGFAALALVVAWVSGRLWLQKAVVGTTIVTMITATVLFSQLVRQRRDTQPPLALSTTESAAVFQKLHHQIYHALRASTESDLYDQLAEALSDDVLEEVYCEAYRALVNRRARTTWFLVRRVKPISTEVLPAADVDGPAFRVRYRWRVYGTVNHFGHTHARFNEYEAVYLVRQQDEVWRITDSQARQNKRILLE
jgi:hypothetical protein